MNNLDFSLIIAGQAAVGIVILITQYLHFNQLITQLNKREESKAKIAFIEQKAYEMGFTDGHRRGQ